MFEFLTKTAYAALPDATSTTEIATQGLTALWDNIQAFLDVAWAPLIALGFIFAIIRLVRRKSGF